MEENRRPLSVCFAKGSITRTVVKTLRIWIVAGSSLQTINCAITVSIWPSRNLLSRGGGGGSCFKCKGKHHTSLCFGKRNTVLTGYTPFDATLLPTKPVDIWGATLWAYLDTGSGKNFISQDAAKKLKLSPVSHETRHIVTVSGSERQSLPNYNIEMTSIDGRAREKIEVTGTKMPNFTVVKRPDMNKLKQKFRHTKVLLLCIIKLPRNLFVLQVGTLK